MVRRRAVPHKSGGGGGRGGKGRGRPPMLTTCNLPRLRRHHHQDSDVSTRAWDLAVVQDR